MNFFLLHLLDFELNKPEPELLSIQQIKTIKNDFKTLLIVGILKNLQPNLPCYTKLSNYNEILYNYSVLKGTICGFCHFIKSQNLRLLIVPYCLQGLLVGLYQITSCPLKKPSKTPEGNFLMTPEIYGELLKDREYFKDILINLQATIHPVIFLKECMALFQETTPMWFKKALSNTLTNTLKSKSGVKNITLSLLDGVEDDRTKTWKVLQTLTKLFLSAKSDEINAQLMDLVETTKNNKNLVIFERLIVSCAKQAENESLMNKILEPLNKFIDPACKNFENKDITREIEQSVRLIYGLFIDETDLPCLSTTKLQPLLGVVFLFYKLTIDKSKFLTINKELGEILTKYLEEHLEDLYEIFDKLIFGINLNIRKDVLVEVESRITVKMCEESLIYATAENADFLVKMLKTEQKTKFFGYLLNCVVNKEKYFTQTRSDLLDLEDSFKNPLLERLLIIHKLLSELSEDKTIQKCLKDNPDEIIKYFVNVLTSDPESSNVFTIIMMLDNFLVNTKNLEKYKILIEPLKKIMTINKDEELQRDCKKILGILEGNQVDEQMEIEDEGKSDLDLALEDIHDPLLPTRGHGLMTLTKLLQNKDKKAMERKQYILNLFQLHLKNEDSFIYLTAIQGLAAMADVFTETVLNILCEEYNEFNRKTEEDGHEIRMKLGEVLVRTIKGLGEMAPKYKALLLNTFLIGAKDDDPLHRASSLSNLGEVCRVLGYKLGTIITEVLVCVHDVIANDKSMEARRAAITVIRQLFVGLENEMLSFLKDDILPIYRTLKEIYYRDNDDIMRLQAQLALEELNENMRTIIFPKPILHFEKNFIQMLN